MLDERVIDLIDMDKLTSEVPAPNSDKQVLEETKDKSLHKSED